ncbi:MAG: O-antigen ligase family protein [Herbinix sp.]|nr:O-antigen ligase family protein [Herbinix sp.]
MSYNKKHRTKQVSYSKKNNKQSKGNTTPQRASYWLLAPIIFMMSVLPFITRLKQSNSYFSKFPWYPINDNTTDFFLYYKQVFFLIAVTYMAVIVIYKAYTDKKSLVYSPILIPLAVYGVMAILSSLFSKYRSYSFRGTHDHFESLFVLLGYCLIVYYIMLYVQTEKDLELIINCFVASIILMSLLGLTQYIGRDFFTTTLGKKTILPKAYWNELDSLDFNFEKNRVYLTLHNPNYVGSYAALATPLLLTLSLLIRKKIWKLPIYLLALAGIIMSLLGSKSKTSIISLIAAGVLILVLLSRYFIKYFYLTIPLLLFVLGTIFTYNHANDNILVKQIQPALNLVKIEPSLQDIQTLDDKLLVTYKGNQIQIITIYEEDQVLFVVIDEDKNELLLEFNPEKGSFLVQDDRFSGFELGYAWLEDLLGFYVTIDGHNWYFTNNTEDGSYYFINRYGKLDKINEAPSAVFTGYEKYASGRGYIWSRTLPLLKKHLILGSGADTFTLAYPQQDYVNLYNYGYGEQLLTKPHNLYLQTGVQTGVLSLIAYLIFYGMYFISSLKLYIKGRFRSYYAQVGVAILVSTFGYMIVSFANDSIIAVAPIFWAFIGLGIVINKKAKPLIEEEIALEKSK